MVKSASYQSFIFPGETLLIFSSSLILFQGAEVSVVSSPPDFVMGETNALPEFLAKFPTGKVPAFETQDGSERLFESNAIAHFLANAQLKGKTPQAQAEIQQWIGFAENEILPPACS